jgi:hypothetical protein
MMKKGGYEDSGFQRSLGKAGRKEKHSPARERRDLETEELRYLVGSRG